MEIDIILLPDPGPKIGYLEDNKKIIREALMDTPPAGGQKPNIAHFIIAHSLSGRAILACMMDKTFAKHILENYAHPPLLIAPHVMSPYQSKPVLNALYTSYCKMFANKSYGEAPLDWVFSASEKFKKMLKLGKKDASLREDFQKRARVPGSTITTDNTTITHGQILYSNQEGEKLWERIQHEGVPEEASRIPMIMLGGSRDFVSCPNTIRNIADAFGAQFHEFDTYHHPFLESKSARKLILKLMRDATDNWENITVPNDSALMRSVKKVHSGFKRLLKASMPNNITGVPELNIKIEGAGQQADNDDPTLET